MDQSVAKKIIKTYSVLNWIASISIIIFGISELFQQTSGDIIIGIIMIILGILLILLGIYLWNFKNWARIVCIVLLCIGFLSSLFLLISMISLLNNSIIPLSIGLIVSPIVGVLISVIFLYLFAFNKTVIAIFK